MTGLAPSGGRPLRFLAGLLGAWVGVRVALLWPDPLPAIVRELGEVAIGPAAASTPPPSPPVSAFAEPGPTADRGVAAASAPVGPDPSPIAPAVTSAPTAERPRAPTTRAAPPIIRGDWSAPAASAPREAPDAAPSRWSASVYALVRGDGRAGGVATPQLGGSQLGARLAYALDDAGRLAAVARAAAALGTRQQEVAVGIEWQPTAAPVRLVAERRVGIAGIAGGWGAGAVGGTSVAIGPARLDGYGQAGIVARRRNGQGRADGYVDATVRLLQPVVGLRDGVALELGAGSWAAAQRGAARLDAGPSLALTLPLGDRPVRLALDWRQRLAGDARPGSGPVLSIGRDF